MIRKISAVIQWIISAIILVTITINAETWVFGNKLSGEPAIGTMYAIGISGGVIGVVSYIGVKRADIFAIAWYCIWGGIVLVNWAMV